MEQGRNTWTDARLDDLSDRMDAGFARVDRELRATNERMEAGFARADARMDAGFARVDDRMDAGFARLDARMDAFQRTILATGGGIMAALIALIATQL